MDNNSGSGNNENCHIMAFEMVGLSHFPRKKDVSRHFSLFVRPFQDDKDDKQCQHCEKSVFQENVELSAENCPTEEAVLILQARILFKNNREKNQVSTIEKVTKRSEKSGWEVFYDRPKWGDGS